MDELDSYSRTVSAVAAEVTPKVAAVRIGRGSGSAVVVPGDGVLVTNAHVVADARRGRADFLDGVLYLDRLVGRHRRAGRRAVRDRGWGEPGHAWDPASQQAKDV